MIDLGELVALETAVWQALVRGDAGADEALLSDDFLGVYPTGFARRDEHVASLAAGPTVRRFEISDPRMIRLGDEAALLAYHAMYERAGGAAEPEEMYVSSLWCRQGETWRNVFSQDTPATGHPVV